MTREASVAAGVAAVALAAGGFAVATGTVELFSSSSATTTGLPPAPLVGIVSVGETEIQLDWGPQQPQPLYAGAATTRSLVVRWGASKDTLHPTGLTYTFSKNGKVIVAGLTRLYNKVGFTTSVRTFRACVKAVGSTGKSSSPMCATFTGSGPPS